MPVPSLSNFAANSFPSSSALNALISAIKWNQGGFSGARPTFRARLNTAQSIPTGVETVIKYDLVDEDTATSYSTSTGIYTATTAGLYYFLMMHNWASNTTASRFLHAISSGFPTNTYSPQISAPAGGLTSAPAEVQIITRLAVGDTVRFLAYQDTGSALLSTNSAACHLTGYMAAA